MSKKATSEAMELLHAAVAKELADQIRKGEVSSATLAVAVRFLKDNDIQADLDTNPAMRELAQKVKELGLDGEGEEDPLAFTH